VLQAKRQYAKRARHGRRIDYRQHGQPKPPRQIRRTGLAIEQTHDPFYDDQVCISRSFMKASPHIVFTCHPQIYVVHRLARGQLKPHRIQKIRPTLKSPHPHAGARMQTRQCSGDRGLTLAGGRCGNEDSGRLHF
jgi:hypothetical protein